VSECLRSAAPEPITVATLVTQHPALKRDLLVSFIAPANRRGPTISTIPSIELSESDFCNSLQSICRERLPAFMVPDMILAIDFLPLAVISGKADGKLLRQIFRDTPLDNLLGHKNKEKRPLTSVEEKVRDVLATMVGDDIEINHNTTTLELGIDSLAAISLCARLAAAGFSSPVPYLLRGPSVAEIAKRPLPQTDISANPSTTLVGVRDYFQSLNHHGRSVLSDLDPESIQIVLPSLPLQGGLVSRSLDSPTPLYINHVIFRVPHSARAGLIEAFNAAIVVNDILRTCFGVIDNKIVQVVLNPNAYSNPWVLDKQFPEDNLLSEARMLLDEIAVDISVKLLSIPPLRLSLLSNTEENILVLSMHHSIYDGLSISCRNTIVLSFG
jgi:ferricrocin synthase